MPGPNSAPNGDAGLVRGHEKERFEYCQTCNFNRSVSHWEQTGEWIEFPPVKYPARIHEAKHKRLCTGKTAKKRD